MKPPKLMSRILSALALQPMTLRQLCIVLTSAPWYTRSVLADMLKDRVVVGHGGIRAQRGKRRETLYVVNLVVGRAYP